MYANGAACRQIPDARLAHPTASRIEGFLHYPDGWSNGEGRRFAKQTVEVALRLHRRLLQRGLMHTSASAGLDGEGPDDLLPFQVEKGIECDPVRGHELVDVRHHSADAHLVRPDLFRGGLKELECIFRIPALETDGG